MLVVMGINFSNRKELYEDTKCALQKLVVGIMEESVRTESVKAENKGELFGDRLYKTDLWWPAKKFKQKW